MNFNRRHLLAAGLGAGAAVSVASTGAAEPAGHSLPKGTMPPRPGTGPTLGLNRAAVRELEPNVPDDQTVALQLAIDAAAQQGVPLYLPPGRFRAGHLKLRPNSRLLGAARTTVLEFTGGKGFLTAEDAYGILIEGLVIEGGNLALDRGVANGLLSLKRCLGMRIRDVEVRRSLSNGIALEDSAGTISETAVTAALLAGIKSLDSKGLEITGSTVTDCGNAGIQIWRSRQGEDGSIVTGNRIERIAARSGGTGENGNGINVFRAGNVLVASNRIADCAYSAIRGNAASNIQMLGNSCHRLGEVALYAEFGFEGALIANNVVDGAATGIEVTNFDHGGRLAVVEGNLIRNLVRREHEPEDKRGDGIGIEADAAVTGNVIEGAPNAGIVVGWGRFMRDVTVAQNVIRSARYGILVTSDPAAGACLIAQNMISGAREGAIRGNDHGRAEGPDLAAEPPKNARLSLSGNVAV